MANSKTTYCENKFLDHVLGQAAFTQPTTYLGLLTSDPGEDGDASGEVSGGGYARVAVAAHFGAASNGTSSNTSDIEFPQATADWGTITHVGLFDAATNGNMLYHEALTSAKTVSSGDIVKFLTGDLTFSEE